MELQIRLNKTKYGTYYILRLKSKDEQNQFIANLSKDSEISEEKLITDMSGMNMNDQVKQELTMKRISNQGKLMILGWSGTHFVIKVLGVFFLASVIGIPLFVIVGWLISC